VISLLSTVVGEGRIKATVNADFDFSRVAETQTLVDGENAAVRTISKDKDMMEGNRPLPGGQPGVKSQVPGAENQQANNPSATNRTDRNQEVISYEIPKTTKTSEKPMATLKRVSVSVLVDAVQVADAAAPGGFRSENVPQAKLDEYRALIANAVGWEQGRDPQIEVRSAPFFKEDLAAATLAAQQAERGWEELMGMMLQISLMLGIMNLLPIPMLDGGTFVFCVIEGIRGKPLRLKTQVVMQNIGLTLLLSLFAFTMVNDLLRWAGH
jgi:flagellar biosynthesis/type III secretory pathway M-ring protein FliF/YscJ